MKIYPRAGTAKYRKSTEAAARVLAMCLVGLGVAPAAKAASYTFTPYSIPGSSYTIINGINDNGQFVGQYDFEQGRDHGFLQSPGASAVAIDDPSASNELGFGTVANGINDNGDIVGVYGHPAPGALVTAFELTAAHGYTDVFASFDNGYNSYAYGLTNNGQVVGSIFLPSTSFRMYGMQAIVDFGDGTALTFPAPGEVQTNMSSPFDGTAATGINTYGAVVGSYTVAPGRYGVSHGFEFSISGFSVIEPLGAVESAATGINDAGVITGWYATPDPSGGEVQHGFVEYNGQYQSIDVPGSSSTVVTGLNNAGDIVGYDTVGAPTDRNYRLEGFIGTPGITLPPGGFVRGPFPGFPSPAPEPAAWTLLIVGLGAVGAAARRRRDDRGRRLAETICA